MPKESTISLVQTIRKLNAWSPLDRNVVISVAEEWEKHLDEAGISEDFYGELIKEVVKDRAEMFYMYNNIPPTSVDYIISCFYRVTVRLKTNLASLKEKYRIVEELEYTFDNIKDNSEVVLPSILVRLRQLFPELNLLEEHVNKDLFLYLKEKLSFEINKIQNILDKIIHKDYVRNKLEKYSGRIKN